MEDIMLNLLEIVWLEESQQIFYFTCSAVSSFRFFQLLEKMWLPGSEPLSLVLGLPNCKCFLE